MREQYRLTTMDEKPKTRFGNYELVRRIDAGGMGEVYLAHQLTAFNRSVAIKIIRNDLVNDLTARERFLREAKVSAHLKHEHILPLYDFGEVDGQLFLVTPYIEGGTLATRLKDRGSLSLSDTYKLFVPLVLAVGYIHRRGVIHRDLKPTNIMLDTEDGEVYVRLIDFGIASLQGQAASPPLTRAGNEVGTIAYMAPERLSGIAAPSNDIFSLGVILHQMLTGQMPVSMPTPSKASASRLPEPLAQVVRRCITTNPAERYATAEELLKGFEEAYQQVRGQTQALGTSLAEPSLPALERRKLDAPEPTTAPSHKRVSLARSAEMPALLAPEKPTQIVSRPPTPAHFTPEDYNAPTTAFQTNQPSTPPTRRPPLLKLRPPKSRSSEKRSRLLLSVSFASVLVLAIIGVMLFYAYQTVTAVSVQVNFSPKSQTISQVFLVKADPRVKNVDTTNATIPEGVANSSKTQQGQGETTGVTCNIFFICQQAVSQDDVNNLADQIKPSLDQSIRQDLQAQIRQAQGRQVGQVNLFNETITSSPQVNQPSKKVSVTVTEQGIVRYIKDSQVRSVVQAQLLAKVAQLGQGFQIVDSTTQIGSLTITSIDSASGLTSIEVPAGTVAQYHFTQDQLQAITNGLANKSLTDAKTFLKNQPGIDTTSITIHFTSGGGSTMPSDTERIKIIPLPPGTLPTVSLTPVPNVTSN
jgi:serine/threonine protein kinase